MSEAPERIWAGMVTTQHYPLVIQRLWDVERFGDKTGYVRVDLYEQQAKRIAELERHATFNIQSKIDKLTLNNIYVVVESMPGGLSTVLVLSPNQTVNSKDEVDYFSDVASALDWAAWRAAKPKPAQPPQEQSE